MNLKPSDLSVFPAGACKGLPPGEQVTLAWLWHHKQRGGARLPSLNTLAADCGISRRSLIDQLKSLQARGLVKVVTIKSDDGSYETNHYELPMAGEITSPSACDFTSPAKPKWDVRPYLLIWKEKYGGYFSVDRCSVILKRAEKDYGRDVVIEAMKNYVRLTPGMYASVHRFCSTIKEYIQTRRTKQYDASLASGSKRW